MTISFGGSPVILRSELHIGSIPVPMRRMPSPVGHFLPDWPGASASGRFPEFDALHDLPSLTAEHRETAFIAHTE